MWWGEKELSTERGGRRLQKFPERRGFIENKETFNPRGGQKVLKIQAGKTMMTYSSSLLFPLGLLLNLGNMPVIFFFAQKYMR